MADRRSKSASPASAWLPEGVKPRSPEAAEDRDNGAAASGDPAGAKSAPVLERTHPEAGEWLLPERGAPSRRRAKKPAAKRPAARTPRNGATAAPEAAKAEPAALAEQEKRIAQLEGALEERQAELAKLEGTLGQRDANVAELEGKLEEREADLAELEQAVEQREAQLAEARRKQGGGLKDRDATLKDREAAVKERLSKRFEKREAELNKQFDQRQAELEKQLEELEERIDVGEAELRQQARQREAELQGRIEELESALAEAQKRAIAKPARRTPTRKGGKLDLNETTFEQLRDLGISVTLSARVISYRDARGGFESLDELDEIPGLSAEFKRVLRDQLKLG